MSANELNVTLGAKLANLADDYLAKHQNPSFWHNHQEQALAIKGCEHLTQKEAVRVACNVLLAIKKGSLSQKIIEAIDTFDDSAHHQAIVDAGDKLPASMFHIRFARAAKIAFGINNNDKDKSLSIGQLLAQIGVNYLDSHPRWSLWHGHQSQAGKLLKCQRLNDKEAITVATDVLMTMKQGTMSQSMMEVIEDYKNKQFQEAIHIAIDSLSPDISHKRFAKAVRVAHGIDSDVTLGKLLSQIGQVYTEKHPHYSFWHGHQSQARKLADCEGLNDKQAVLIAKEVLLNCKSGSLSKEIIAAIDTYKNNAYHQAITNAGDNLSGRFHHRFANALPLAFDVDEIEHSTKTL
jgi:hypothetical protein